jgi:RNA 2',3'-cyclic 3'-phosphodiesterase
MEPMSGRTDGRLFVAAPLDDGARDALDAHLRRALGPAGVPGRQVPPRNWHLTLRFLGDCDAAAGERMVRALEDAVSVPPFEVTFGGAGAFPRPRTASVFWIDVDEGADGLAALAAGAEAAARVAGFAADTRPYRPHLTVSRLRPPADVTDAVARVPAARVRMMVGEVVLFRSELGGGAPRYEPVARLPLS